MKPSANVLIHCDWRACHHIRVMMDDVLGAGNFVNHLVWAYGLGGSSPRTFARKHDDILFYRVSEAGWFEAPRVPATSRRMRGQTKKATDVLDIPSLNNMSRERTGYPTQKPLALLDVLVRACCPPGGLVLDPCCGSGTTLVAALRAGRRAAGFDVSEEAVRVATGRVGGETVRG
jgi:DNA modification methylase